MKIREHPFNLNLVKKGKLFPSSIEDDFWVAYHGTSNIFENQIETIGFQANECNYSKKDIEKVVSLYEEMNWFGEVRDGFACLKPFSLNHDYTEENKPNYFSPAGGCGSIRYATKDCSGGEALSLVRNCIKDLEQYITSEDVRERHIKKQKNEIECNPYVPAIDDKGNVVGKKRQIVFVNLNWLQNNLTALSYLKELSSEVFNSYEHGVVYAVKFEEDDLSQLEYNNFMGLKAFGIVKPDRIIAKVKIPQTFKWNVFESKLDTISISNFGEIWKKRTEKLSKVEKESCN